MGYTTYFSGEVAIDPPLNEHEVSFLLDFNRTRRMHRTGGPLFVKGEDGQWGSGQGSGPDTVVNFNQPDPDQPGLWCQWRPSEDGAILEWDGGEKFYDSPAWMEYVVMLLSADGREYVAKHVEEDERLQHFTNNHVLDGEIHASGEEDGDLWKIVVTANEVEVVEALITYSDELPIQPGDLVEHVYKPELDARQVVSVAR